MAKRTGGLLTALAVKRASERGLYGDGHGLYLQISRNGSRSWVLRYKIAGRTRTLGLGPLHTFSLAQARDLAAAARRQIAAGIDPIQARRASKVAAALDAAKTITFDAAADAYVKAHAAGWKNKKHGAQWSATLKAYASPVFGKLPVAAVDTALVLRALEKIWTTKPETAARVRGRVESVLDWAKVRGYRDGANPAAWRGHLDHLLPARSKVRHVKHHSALPYSEIGSFMRKLRSRDATAARTLEFAILTAARTGEVLAATWDEIDLPAKTWTIPASRMKAGREHRVPLSAAALAVLKSLPTREGFLFPGQKRGKPLSNMAMLVLLDRMGRDDLTAHGFRSTFRDWGAERTNYPNEVVEMALAHTVASKVEAAYRRGDLYDKRVRLMRDWAAYCDAPASTGNVVPLHGA